MQKTRKKNTLGPNDADASFGPFFVFVGLRWLLLAAVSLRWPALGAVGRRWPALAVVGCCGPSRASSGPKMGVVGVVGVMCVACVMGVMGVVGVVQPADVVTKIPIVVNKTEKKTKKKTYLRPKRRVWRRLGPCFVLAAHPNPLRRLET